MAALGRISDDEIQALISKLRVFLEKRYQLKISRLERLDRGVLFLEANGDVKWIVRVFSENRPIERVDGDAEILRFLELNDFPAERCATKDPVSSPGRWGVLVSEYIDGKEVDANLTNLRKLGSSLGVLNSIPLGNGAETRDAGSLHHYSRVDGLPRNEIDAANLWLKEVSDKVSIKIEDVFESLREQIAGVDDCEGLPCTLIHPDPVLKNVIETTKEELKWIDWTGAGKGPRLYSLAILLWSGALRPSGWSAENVDAVVSGYREHVDLTKDEIERLPDIMKIRQIIFACWRFRFSIRKGIQPSGKEWWWPSDDLVDQISKRAVQALGK
jgi:Ser/Thr protein kinase RdoA (MazF antagonist)